jgi:hypothetical protein
MDHVRMLAGEHRSDKAGHGIRQAMKASVSSCRTPTTLLVWTLKRRSSVANHRRRLLGRLST